MWPFRKQKKATQTEQGRQLRMAAKELGYDIAQMNYFYDYLTGIRQWSNHINSTRQFITKCARMCNQHNTCAVLGSGFCFDVPMLELSNMFKKVYLMDMIHPPKIQYKAAEFANVELITEDITKIAIETSNSINRYKDFAVDLLISSPNYSEGNYCDTLGDFDLVISVNTLPFLATPIINYLSKVSLLDQISSHNLECFVHQYHINMLPKGKSCIISPISKRLYNSEGLQMYDRSIAYIPKDVIVEPESWTWNYSNTGTERIEYGVKAWRY